MVVSELESLRQQYRAARPGYQTLADSVAQQLRDATRKRGVPCEIDGRAKDMASFLKKALRKDYESPWNDIRDKAGVRVITIFHSQVQEIETIVRELFVVHHCEDKRQSLPPDTLRYLGVHFEVSLQQDSGVENDALICEIQIHTQAQNLWATVSHELLYKPTQEAPTDITRAIYRLMALLELFDGEVERGRDEILQLPGYEEAHMLITLEQQFYTFVARHTDTDLSKQIIAVLLPLFEPEQASNYGSVLEPFIEHNRDKLEQIFSDYAEDDRNPLLSQPECLLVFERLSADPFKLAVLWGRNLPAGLLRSLSEIWGTPVDV
ncbi:RelA/SpoT domain-containing protein [Ferrimicrobium sp.]|nr:RelA/SpoT domain-containing protein [Ferrimicrobium sp.]